MNIGAVPEHSTTRTLSRSSLPNRPAVAFAVTKRRAASGATRLKRLNVVSVISAKLAIVRTLGLVSHSPRLTQLGDICHRTVFPSSALAKASSAAAPRSFLMIGKLNSSHGRDTARACNRRT